MNCGEVKRLVRMLLVSAGSNPPGELTEHLQACRACDARYARLLAIAAQLHQLPEKEVPPGFDDRFRRKLVGSTHTEGRATPVSEFPFLLANDGLRWILFLVLGIGPIAVALGDGGEASSRPLLISAANVGVMAAGLLFAAAFVHAVLHLDIITDLLRGKEK